MERQKKVVDASVILKSFVNEDKSEIARKIIRDHFNGELVIIAPEFIILEILNSLRFKGKNLSELREVNETLQNAQFLSIPLNTKILNIAISISLEYDLTIYDSLYAALSQVYGCELITEDKKLQKFQNAVSL